MNPERKQIKEYKNMNCKKGIHIEFMKANTFMTVINRFSGEHCQNERGCDIQNDIKTNTKKKITGT